MFLNEYHSLDFAVLMTSSSSNIKIKSGPVDEDVLWIQDMHVSQHIWNEEEDRKLHIRLHELSPRIKVKNKYQKKLFLYFGNLVFTRL